MRHIFAVLLAPSLAVMVFCHEARGDRDILWKIVDNCLENNGTIEEYCRKCPQPLPSLIKDCDKASSEWEKATLCKKTTNVLDKTSDLVALQDRKMCDCLENKNFFHGLVLPCAKVTGIEDKKNLPQGGWQYAWDQAIKKIKDKESIALVVNQRDRRTQDQLHFHMVRLAESAREKLGKLAPRRVKDLKDVWSAAAQHAWDARLAPGSYGVLVMYDKDSSEFLVTAVEGHAEKLYTVYKCPE